MLFTRRHFVMYDELGDDGLVDLANLICRQEYGETGLVPYPSKGKDGGVDGKHVAVTAGKPHIQSKWREVAAYNDRPLRAAMLKTFETYLAECRAAGKTGKLIFITNVRRTAGDITESEAIMARYTELATEYWDFAKLWHFMLVYPDIKDRMLPQYSARELRQKKEELDRREAEQAKKAKELLRRTPEFQAAALKLKRLHIDWKLLEDQYIGFIYLVEPLYVDDQDGARAVIRELFSIDEDAEQKVIDQLHKQVRIDITGNIITVADAKDAAQAAAQIVQHMGADLERIITLIQGA